MTQSRLGGPFDATGVGKADAMFDDFTTETPVKAGTAGHDECGQACPKDESSPAPLSQPESQRQAHESHSTFDITREDILRSDTEPQLNRSINPGIASITRRLSNSHLRIGDGHHPPSLLRGSTSTCSLASSQFAPSSLGMEADHHPKPSMSSRSPPLMASPSASPLEENLVRSLPHPKQDMKHLRRQISSKFNHDAQSNRAIQARVEGMISTGTLCNVYTPPLDSTAPIDADDTNNMDFEMQATSLEVDDNPDDDTQYESPFIEKFLSLRRSSGLSGIRKSGFPLHQSSTETALRCQHLVRNKPRMRKRSKLKRQSSLAAISTGDAPSVGSSPAAS